MAVPAVHHQSAFAAQVHAICRNIATRPNAIVVELGHSSLMELVSFLKELKQGTSKKELLPCMMGILVRNNCIHPDFVEKASLLQEFYEKPLYHLPDDILAERLNFNKWSTLVISPADSIIEAVRCAIELDIPVYGIDLEDFSRKDSEIAKLEDPQNAHNNSVKYTDRVMKYCDSYRDHRIDFNREIFMTSGLKYYLEKHSKVLLTCGMAHWNSIVSLLKSDDIQAFPVHEIALEIEHRRVILHPTIAASFMEVLPQITFEYEKRRYPVTSTYLKAMNNTPETILRSCLDATYKIYSSEVNDNLRQETDSAKWSNIGQFEQFLFHLATIKQQKIPNSTTLIDAAEVMMDDHFCRILMEQIMKVKPAWASNKQFPDLPMIIPPESRDKNNKGSNGRTRVKLVKGKSDENEMEEFYTGSSNSSENSSQKFNKYWSKSDKRSSNGKGYHSYWLWPPCESLIYGLAFKAAEISNINQNRCRQSVVFEGSLEGGIDTKATIRSMIRNEKKIYISRLSVGNEQSIIDGTMPDPFVFFFPNKSNVKEGIWSVFTAGRDLSLFVKNQDLLKKTTRQMGNVFVSSIVVDEYVEAPSHLKSLFSCMSKAHGTVMFGNPCINAKQSAIWLESSNYKCCPIVRGSDIYTILQFFEDNFDVSIEIDNWKEALIRMAIPFAKKSVTIISDDSLELTARVLKEAAQRKIMLNIVSHDNFSEAQLEEARHRFTVPTLDKAGLQFLPEAEIILGQTKDAYFEMLPYAIRKQVGFKEK